MKRVLITGCEGFIGSHVADLFVARGFDVAGLIYASPENVEHLRDKVRLLRCDLRQPDEVKEVIVVSKPDIVVHLAAQSLVTTSWADPRLTLDTNVIGTFNLLDAIRESPLDPRVIVVGSSAVYGSHSATEMPLTESSEFRPTSIYAVSKVAEDMLGSFFFHAYGIQCVRVRPFSITGPRKRDDACSDFCRGVVEFELGVRGLVEVGNLDTIRDFTDGRDAARALYLLAETGTPGEVYNICSGVGRKMCDVLHTVIAISGLKIEYEVVSVRLRQYDDMVYVGDNARLRGLGWTPQIPFEQTVSDMLDYWRATLK